MEANIQSQFSRETFLRHFFISRNIEPRRVGLSGSGDQEPLTAPDPWET